MSSAKTFVATHPAPRWLNILAVQTYLLNHKPNIMRRALSIFALALLAVGMYSCEPETDVQETEALMKTMDQEAGDGKHSDGDEGRGNG